MLKTSKIGDFWTYQSLSPRGDLFLKYCFYCYFYVTNRIN